MNPVPELAPNLKQLRLSGILDSLDDRNREAVPAPVVWTRICTSGGDTKCMSLTGFPG